LRGEKEEECGVDIAQNACQNTNGALMMLSRQIRRICGVAISTTKLPRWEPIDAQMKATSWLGVVRSKTESVSLFARLENPLREGFSSLDYRILLCGTFGDFCTYLILPCFRLRYGLRSGNYGPASSRGPNERVRTNPHISDGCGGRQPVA